MFRARAPSIAGVGALMILFLLVAPASVAGSPRVPIEVHEGAVPHPLAAPKILYKIPLGKIPSGGAVDTLNGNVFVSNEGSNDVTVINATTHGHSTISVGKAPDNLVYDPSNGDVYVPNQNSSSVSIINGASNKVTATVKLGTGTKPVLASVDPANGDVLVFNNLSLSSATNAWLIVNSTHAVKKLSLGLGIVPTVAYSPKSRDLYVPNPSLGVVQAISPSGTVKSIAVPGSPETVIYWSVGSVVLFLVAPNATRPGGVDFITSSNAVGPVSPFPIIAGSWVGFPGTYDPYNHQVYFVSYNFTTNTSYAVWVSPPGIFAGLVSLGTGLFFELAVDPANSDLDVGSYTAHVVDVLNKSSMVVKTLKPAQSIIYFVYDPTAKEMFGAGFVNATTKSILYAISSGNSLSSVTVGDEAIAFAYDPVDTYVYVANIGSDSLDIVN